MPDKKVALITGCSSGFGYLSALALAREGWAVCATMRDLSASEKLRAAAESERLDIVIKRIDVRDGQTVLAAVAELVSERGRIDLLVNNAGYGLIGALEDLSMEQITAQMDTNFLGAVRMIRAVTPVFRSQKSGLIINISSVAGLVGMPLYSAYCASKFALEGLSEALSFEAELYNIRVINIEPGPFATNFSGSSMVWGEKARHPDSPYRALTKYFLDRAAQTSFASPDAVASLIVRAASGKKRGMVNTAGSKVRELWFFKRFLGFDIARRIMKILMRTPVKPD